MSPHPEPSPQRQMTPDPYAGRSERARGCTVEQRRGVLGGFFTRWPGVDSHPLGLGRALADFQEWEIDSDRIVDGGGSPWWSTVNGWLVNDLADATAGVAGPWAEYLDAVERGAPDCQAHLWVAHQDSIEGGVAAAVALLAEETDAEQAFARIALEVVDAAATAQQRTSSGSLGRHTRDAYPRRYPCTQEDLDLLRGLMDSPGG